MNAQQPSPETSASPNAESYGFRLTTRLTIGLIILIAAIVWASISLIWIKARPQIAEIGDQSQMLLGQSVALALDHQFSQVAGIARSLAAIGESAAGDEQAIFNYVPTILDQMGRDGLVAGGGIWPEPYAFSKDKVRNSFFWGRDAQGKLRFFDDYNNPDGHGYHNEEWYVPARLLQPGQVYWSRSYTDPYSLQPMVTCTAPIYSNGEFIGVATVDLRLDRVSLVLDRLVNTLNAYAFVVDRNNKFIAYPYPERVMTQRLVGGKSTPDYIYAEELALLQPSFQPLADTLAAIERRIFGRFSQRTTDYMLNVDLLANASYQIDAAEARRIAAYIWNLQQNQGFYPEELGRQELPKDGLLFDDAAAIVYQLADTNWKVVTVFRHTNQLGLTDGVFLRMVWGIVASTLLLGLLGYAYLHRQLFRPLRRLLNDLSEVVSQPTRGRLELSHRRKDELGLIAFWFNQRSSQLEVALTEAETANRAKTAFLAKMSHEFRTPLNSIIGFSRRLQDKLKHQVDEFHYEAIRRIHTNGHHLLALVNDIIDMTAIESGGVKLRAHEESVNELLQEAVAECQIYAERSEVRLVKKELAVDVLIVCDRNKVVQILVNLLSNALKATRRGSVQLSVKQLLEDREHIYFEVVDTGIGISEQDQQKLFKKFSQLESRIGSERGTGLGLFLVREFVKMHGGSVDLTSELGVGTTFTVKLPVKQTQLRELGGGDSSA